MDVFRRFFIYIFILSAFLAGCDGKSGTQDKSSAVSVGTALDDSVITTKVKSALIADPEVKSFEIKVDTRKGEVQLSGFVDNQSQVNRALDIARRVEGVKNVSNHMTLKDAVPSSTGNLIDDSIITTKIKSSFLADDQVKGLDISVVTHKGEVQLSGFANPAQIDRAVQLAGRVDGVKNVINKMSVKK